MPVLKYTKEQETQLALGYKACDSDDDRESFIILFCRQHQKSKHSVVAKLSKLDIYKARAKVSKVTNETPKTKDAMVREFAIKIGADPDKLQGLDKAPKLVLLYILTKV